MKSWRDPPRNPHTDRGLSCNVDRFNSPRQLWQQLPAVVMSTSAASAANICPATQVAPVSCPDGNVRKIGNLVVTARFNGEVGIIQFDPKGTEADVFVHARWSGYGAGNIRPLPLSPKEQLVLTSDDGSRYTLHQFDECGKPGIPEYGGLVTWGPHLGFAGEPATGDLIVSERIVQQGQEVELPDWADREHPYHRVAADGSSNSSFSAYLSIDGVSYEGADSGISGAITFGPNGTLW